MTSKTTALIKQAMAEGEAPNREVAPKPVVHPRDDAMAEDPPFESKSIVAPKPIFDRFNVDETDPMFGGDDEQAQQPQTLLARTPEPQTLVAPPQRRSTVVTEPLRMQPSEPQIVTMTDRLTKYQGKKTRIMFRMTGGTVMMTVIEVLVGPAAIMVVLPTETDGCIFIPSVGEPVTLIMGAKAYDCEVPGLVTEVPDLGVTMLTLIRKEVIGASNE